MIRVLTATTSILTVSTTVSTASNTLQSIAAAATAMTTAATTSTASASDTTVWAIDYPWFLVEFWLEIIGCVIGFYGSVWVINQFFRRKILRNTPGLIICIIGFLDILHTLYYAATVLILYTQSDMGYSWVWQALDAMFNWCLISYALLGMLLAFNTLFIVLGGSSLTIQKAKWPAIALCFILPVPAFFWPVSNWRSQLIFTTTDPNCNGDDRCEPKRSYVLLFTIVCSALLSSLVAYFGIWYNLNKDRTNRGKGTEGKALKMVKTLTMVYSLSIVFCWIPWMVRWAWLNFETISQSDFVFLHDFSIVTFVILFRALWTSMRGYIHAFAVLHVYKLTAVGGTSTWSLRNMARQILLLSPVESGHESSVVSKEVEGGTVSYCPDWKVTVNHEANAGVSVNMAGSVFSGDGLDSRFV